MRQKSFVLFFVLEKILFNFFNCSKFNESFSYHRRKLQAHNMNLQESLIVRDQYRKRFVFINSWSIATVFIDGEKMVDIGILIGTNVLTITQILFRSEKSVLLNFLNNSLVTYFITWKASLLEHIWFVQKFFTLITFWRMWREFISLFYRIFDGNWNFGAYGSTTNADFRVALARWSILWIFFFASFLPGFIETGGRAIHSGYSKVSNFILITEKDG